MKINENFETASKVTICNKFYQFQKYLLKCQKLFYNNIPEAVLTLPHTGAIGRAVMLSSLEREV